MITSYPSESSKKPFRKSVQRVYGNKFGLVVDNLIANGGDKLKEVFSSCKIERRKPFPKTLRSYGMRDIDGALLVGKHFARILCALFDKSYPSAQCNQRGPLRTGRANKLTQFS